jgi:hypothetical protein
VARPCRNAFDPSPTLGLNALVLSWVVAFGRCFGKLSRPVRSKNWNGREHGHLSTGRIAVLQTVRHIFGAINGAAIQGQQSGQGEQPTRLRV